MRSVRQRLAVLLIGISACMSIGCTKRVTAGPPVVDAQQVIDDAIGALDKLSTAASIHIAVVSALEVEGGLSASEAQRFLVWAQPIPRAVDDAIVVLGSADPPTVRITQALQIFVAAQRTAVLNSENAKVRLGYAAMSAALDVVSSRLRTVVRQRGAT